MRDLTQVLHEFGIPENTTTTKIEVGGMSVREAYLIKTPVETYILKWFKPTNMNLVNSAAGTMKVLADKGFNKLPQNLQTITGAYVAQIDGENWELQKYLEGKLINNSELNLEQVKNLASTIADFHNSFLGENNSLNFNEEITYSKMFDGDQHTRMIEAIDKLRQASIPEKDLQLLERYWIEYNKARDEILRKLTNSEEKLQKSLIHRDLNKGNIIFDKHSNDVVGIVDWDTVMWGNILQDICYICTAYLLINKNDFIDIEKSRELIQNFVDSYQSKIKLNNEEKILFPVLAEILRIRGTRWSVKTYGETFMEKDKSELALKDYEKIQGNLNKALPNWMDTTKIIKKLFEEIKL